jgi:hypothetical protein
MFANDINREINGVVKVAQDDALSARQEISEYVITKELRSHFTTFFENYARALDAPTGKIGVWISGFFGSGKSHFLKMLSYLLTNRLVCERRAYDYFADKFDDPMLLAEIGRCTAMPTESILFNIDVEGPVQKDRTAVLRVFAKVFYKHLGFYGDDLKIARLEMFVESQGKTGEFRSEYEKINGQPWVGTRDAHAFFADDIVETLTRVLGMSEAAARGWFDSDENPDMSIGSLISEIAGYAASKGDWFRLLFMVDEVGQYIGDDGDLMLNLQSIAEEIGSRCGGKVWVMVTSQEAIDKVVKISGDDFSKIQGRFDTRLSLSSSSVDEVIRKRILSKSEDAGRLLHMVYGKEQSVLKNLFVFNNPILDIKGFSGADEYAQAYPFVPYQFIVIQDVLAEIRKHGNAGKSLSGGERSMLSGFQEAAQSVQERDENALVPFHAFYDTFYTFLDSTIRRVIDRCQNAADSGAGIERQDVQVLKLLYLLRYIEDVKANIDNIAILMVSDIRADKIALRAEAAGSLGRLLSQNYIARYGDNYSFLTDEEQEIAVDIRNTPVDSADIVSGIAAVVYGDIYPAKKFKYGKYDFAFDQFVDDTVHGAQGGGMRLRVVTAASDAHGAPDAKHMADSLANNEAIVLLDAAASYFEDLEQARKIQKYVKQKNVSQLPASIQDIIRKRQSEARGLEKKAKESLDAAIGGGRFFVHGERCAPGGGDAKSKLDAALTQLVRGVYSKLGDVSVFAESDADILTILNDDGQAQTLPGTGANNEYALGEIARWLELQEQNRMPVSMGDVQRKFGGAPYGWRQIDIAALVARLLSGQKISVVYGGAAVGRGDRRLPDYLRKLSEVDKASIRRRSAPSEGLMRKSVAFLRGWIGSIDVPVDEDGLVKFATAALEGRAAHCRGLLDGVYGSTDAIAGGFGAALATGPAPPAIREQRDRGNPPTRYPGRETVECAKALIDSILSAHSDNASLLTELLKRQDELMDSSEDMEEVDTFFKSQRELFDAASALLAGVMEERDYFASDTETTDAIHSIENILGMEKPYGAIKYLAEPMQKIRDAYAAMLGMKKEEVSGVIARCLSDVHALAGLGGRGADEVKRADDYFAGQGQKLLAATSITVLDAMNTQVAGFAGQILRRPETHLSAREGDDGPPLRGGDSDGLSLRGGGSDGLSLRGAERRSNPPKIISIRRCDAFPSGRLTSEADVEKYLGEAGGKLRRLLEGNDGIQLN